MLIRNHYSLIVPEQKKPQFQMHSLLYYQEQKNNSEQVKLVRDFIKKEGIMSAINKVRSKLDSFKSLGYSSAGIVIESDCPEFRRAIELPQLVPLCSSFRDNFCTKKLGGAYTENVEFGEAAYTTLGSIAMQGVRQAEPMLGENVAVIGLGLLGQITVQLLKANVAE